ASAATAQSARTQATARCSAGCPRNYARRDGPSAVVGACRRLPCRPPAFKRADSPAAGSGQLLDGACRPTGSRRALLHQVTDALQGSVGLLPGRQLPPGANRCDRRAKARAGLPGASGRHAWGLGASSLRPPLSRGPQVGIVLPEPIIEGVHVDEDTPADAANGRTQSVLLGTVDQPANLIKGQRPIGRELCG